VADKGGALFVVELQEEASSLQVGALRKRIRDARPGSRYDDGSGWNFHGTLGKADDEDLVSTYVDLTKQERIVIVRPWNAWYGTFLEEQIARRFPNLSSLVSFFSHLAFSLLFVGIIIGFSKASFTLPHHDVPYTLQTLGVLFATFFLGLWSVVSVGLYLSFGAAGAHVFADNAEGPGALVNSYTSGFLWGFLATSIVVGLLVSWRGWDRNVYTWFLATCIGWITTFVPGLTFFASKVGWDWGLAVQQALVPFLPAEAIKFIIVMICIPLTWFATSRVLNKLDPRAARRTSLWSDVKAFFHPRLISF